MHKKESMFPSARCVICGSDNILPLCGCGSLDLLRCRQCGLAFFSSIPDSQFLKEHYSSYQSSKSVSIVTVARYSNMLDKFEAYRKTNRILDFGCGNGFFLEEALKRGWEVYGTEISGNKLQELKRKNLNIILDLEDACGRGLKFDVITMFEVLEHLIRPDLTVGLLSKMLERGGVLYCTTPNFDSLTRILLGKRCSIVNWPEHLYYFSYKNLDLLMRSNGLRKNMLESSGLRPSDYIRLFKKTGFKENNLRFVDEEARVLIEKNCVMSALKKVVNCLLNLSRKGDSLKATYIKI